MKSTTLEYRTIHRPVVTAETQDEPAVASAIATDARSNDTPDGQYVRWLNYVDKRLKSFAERPAVSDDPEDYPKPPAESVSRARRIAWQYFGSNTPPPNVVPSADGGVEFIWYAGDWHVKIWIDEEGASVWAHNLSTGDLWQDSLAENSERLRKLLEELAGAS